ncbi:EAL domain-containing protein (putative c-di-GMP-specific phosphodiesterase class I) [Azospirillum agricola]|uniref:EAL domain-containing protein n=1 Tax=Azospirillum agricola TaxID=1720247 RepID=UPI001AE69DD1|nr:EAL domain-containing protein [Azospirillum agricola]MBP2227055.1 EAL domain-containing protein (putative c-di-GMP-specific phosphodiesterase class I) [Azospirillum agricola]
MAFQPIVDVAAGGIWAHEALVRGTEGQGAGWVLGQVNEGNRYSFDQSCRVKAIELASGLPMDGARLSINFLPNAVYKAEACIQATLAAARRTNFPTSRIIFEVTENERVVDHGHLKGIFAEYRRQGFMTAIDDFGSGYSGLNLLAEFQPDIIKLDMELTRNIDSERPRRSIVKAILMVCADLGITPVAEGVETAGEADALSDLGIRLMQGYFFAKPAFQAMVGAADIPRLQ